MTGEHEAPETRLDHLFSELLEVAPDAIVGADSRGRIVLVNRQAELLFGYARDRMLERQVEMLVPERFRPGHEQHRSTYFADPRTRPMGARLTLFGLRSDGSEFPAEIALSSIDTDQGLIAITAVRDITQRIAGQRMFEQLLEAAPDAMIGVDEAGRILLVNQQAEQVFGYSRGELLGEPVELLVPDRYHDDHGRHRGGYFAHPVTRPMGAELSLFGRRRDGSEFPAEISLSSIEAADGLVAIAAVRDVTERLVAESVAHEETHRRTVVSAMLRAEEAERARIATALHDDTVQVMTASLMSLDRVCRMLGEDNGMLLAQLEDARRTIAEATERTRRLSFELRPAVLHEQGLTPAITAMIEQAGREIGARVAVHVAPGRFDWPVEELVYRTVQEAVANIRKHSHARNIAVTLTRRGDQLACVVADDGRGFVMSEAAARSDHLLHIGLETMTERVRLAGGELEVDSSPGGGTRVSFEVPMELDASPTTSTGEGASSSSAR